MCHGLHLDSKLPVLEYTEVLARCWPAAVGNTFSKLNSAVWPLLIARTGRLSCSRLYIATLQVQAPTAKMPYTVAVSRWKLRVRRLTV